MSNHCKKLIRCMETAEEHGSYCVNHKPAHEPKRYCEVVLNETHQCSNYARKGETKCASHGEKRYRLRIYAFAKDERGMYVNTNTTFQLNPQIRGMLETAWAAYKEKFSETFHPLSEKFVWKKGHSYYGQRAAVYPAVEVRTTMKEGREAALPPVTLARDEKKYTVCFTAERF